MELLVLATVNRVEVLLTSGFHDSKMCCDEAFQAIDIKLSIKFDRPGR